MLKPQKSSRSFFKVNIHLNPLTIELSGYEKNILKGLEWFKFKLLIESYFSSDFCTPTIFLDWNFCTGCAIDGGLIK